MKTALNFALILLLANLQFYACKASQNFDFGDRACGDELLAEVLLKEKPVNGKEVFATLIFDAKMSVVPLMFRDWWDEIDFPMRTSRLLDQNFGTGLKRDDLLSSVWSSRPTMLRSGYLRPWQRSPTSLQKQESGSTVNIDSEKFEVILDVQQFSPNEITVKVTDKYVIVEGKHEEKQDEHGYVSRQFSRRYMLPSEIHPDSVSSSLSSDGLLTVTAPMKKLPPPNTERVVPISQTGPSSKEENARKIETSTA